MYHVMANNNENTTNIAGKKIAIGLSVDPTFYEILERFRSQEDRPMANMVERLLKTHPRIQPILEAETAEATA